MSKKYRFIAEEDLETIAKALDLLETELPVAKIPELHKAYLGASEALGRSYDAQDRGLFLSMLQSVAGTLGKMSETLMLMEGRATLAQQVAGPRPMSEIPRRVREEGMMTAPREGKPSVPGEEAVILNFDDFGGGMMP